MKKLMAMALACMLAISQPAYVIAADFTDGGVFSVRENGMLLSESQKFIELLNGERAKLGRTPVQLDEKAMELAIARASEDMGAEGKTADQDVFWRECTAGSLSGKAEDFIRLWKSSPAEWALLTDEKYTRLGFAIYRHESEKDLFYGYAELGTAQTGNDAQKGFPATDSPYVNSDLETAVYTGQYGTAAKAAEAAKPAAPKLTGKVTKYQYVDLTWQKTANAKGYEIYGYNSGKKTFGKIATVDGNTLKYEKKIGYGRDGRFKIRAYNTDSNGNKVYGPYSNIVTVQTAAQTPKISSVKASGSKALTVAWNKVSAADGYQVYRYIQKDGNYTLVKTINSGSTTSLKNTGLVNGKIYYYKIKSFRVLDNGKKLYSAFSAPVGCKVGSSVSGPSSGASGSNATGAVIPAYDQVVTKNVDPANFDRTFKQALLEAEENASSSVQYKIVIPPGNYQAGRLYKIPSNTHVYAVGATINATGTRVGMWYTDPAKPSENIIMEGGTWTTLDQPSSVDGTVVRLVGIENMVIKDMVIKTKRTGHIIEAADMNGFTVEGCTFSGNDKDVNASKNVQPKEALQLDVATKEAIPGYNHPQSMLNGKGCHNVVITGNTFTNCGRGVGSHSGTGNGAEKQPYTNIKVTDNIIKNVLGEGIFAQDWRNCTITGNKISNTKQTGIYFLDAYNIKADNNRISNISKYTGKRKATYDPNGVYGVGMLIRRSQKFSVSGNTLTKVYSPGIIQELNCKNMTVKNNKISTR